MGATAGHIGRISVNIPAFAQHWARELGANDQSLYQLTGGINNRVYRCSTAATTFVIKGYTPCAPAQRDRMQAEVAFLRYAQQVAPKYVPQLLHIDPQRRCVVLEYIEGAAYREGVPPTAEDVEAAVKFFRMLNADPEAARRAALPDASDGFLRLTDHLDNVRERAADMRTGHLPETIRPWAGALLDTLWREFEKIAAQTNTRIEAGDVPDAIAPDDRCISPSDFGFHNAIRWPRGVKFIDFEYAGWDDPAKALTDFMLQPRIKINSEQMPLLRAMPWRRWQNITARSAVLRPVLRIKWLCIVMAVLRPERLAQLLATHPDMEPEKLILVRLESAAVALQQEAPFGLH
jgi:hypothetical protein